MLVLCGWPRVHLVPRLPLHGVPLLTLTPVPGQTPEETGHREGGMQEESRTNSPADAMEKELWDIVLPACRQDCTVVWGSGPTPPHGSILRSF